MSHYKDGGQRLYNPADMEKFANKCTPGLFDRALFLVKNNEKQQLSKKRNEETASCGTASSAALLQKPSVYNNNKK